MTGIHLFAITYADEIAHLSAQEIVSQAGIAPSYATEIQDGRRLAEYVQVVNDFP